jgi:hypothetical protein
MPAASPTAQSILRAETLYPEDGGALLHKAQSNTVTMTGLSTLMLFLTVSGHMALL